MRSAERIVRTRWLRQRAVQLVHEKADGFKRPKPVLLGHPGCRNAACELVVVLRVAGPVCQALPWSGCMSSTAHAVVGTHRSVRACAG
jgi:hypothetical protein